MLHQFFYTQGVSATSSKYHLDIIKMLLSLIIEGSKVFFVPLRICDYILFLQDIIQIKSQFIRR